MKSAAVGCLVLALTAVSARPLFAQARATITGTVRNAAGAPQATKTVNLANVDTQTERQAITEMDGTYAFGGLLPGRYQLKVDEAGFAPFAGDILTIAAGDRRTENIALRPVAAPAAAPRAAPVPAPARPAAPAAAPAPVPAPTPTPTDQPAAPATSVTSVPGQASLPATPGVVVPDYIPAPDRWRLEFPVWQRYPPELKGDYPYVTGRKLDPYNRNVLKGDYPVAGNDVFFVLTAISDTPFEYRKTPTIGGVSTARPDTEPFFGKGNQYALAPEAIFSFELFKGDTSFKPRTWALRLTPVFNVNYLNTEENNNVTVTPETGTNRQRSDFAIQEGFAELKLADVGHNYDFVSIRAGIQPFTSDFRGFLYRDTNLGVRLFGTWGRNRNQWNLAAFDQLEKDTNSELNTFSPRKQIVLVANYFRQDFITPGYTISPSFQANLDNGDEFHYDENGFLVRPSAIGDIIPHKVKAYYVGLGGDGHWGRLNITHQFYRAFGHDDFNGISSQKVDIQASFAAGEISIDHDWWRIKTAVVWASGDSNPDDNKAKGFDAIFDNPNIAGGPFSFWDREGIRLTQTSLALTGPSSLLPSLRSSKTEGQANFVNPGIFEYNVGWDGAITQKTNLSLNANLLRFQDTEVLERLLFQSKIDKSIGMDYSLGLVWRPSLNDNIIITSGASLFMPGAGFKNLLTSDKLFAPFIDLTLRY